MLLLLCFLLPAEADNPKGIDNKPEPVEGWVSDGTFSSEGNLSLCNR
ncbi:MAG: hypothetical protein AAFV71_21885 [Cyanobacteria bacterium J06633_8]